MVWIAGPVRNGGACAVEDCDKRAFRRGWCAMHYERWKKYGDLTTVRPPGIATLARGVCSVEGCERVVHVVKDGLCYRHYQRRKRYGDPTVAKIHRDYTDDQRFWTFVDKAGPPWNGSACWLWQGGCTEDGYGIFSARTSRRAHRYAYEIGRGPVPAGLQLDHLCRRTRCVNPDHLEAVTAGENLRRAAVARRAS